jgi:hypothetical protein
LLVYQSFADDEGKLRQMLMDLSNSKEYSSFYAK